MRLFRSASLVLAALLLASSPAAAATATDTLQVTATVTASCTIVGGTLDFGDYNPVGANATTALDAQTSLRVACTNGAGAWIGLDQGSNADAGSTDDAPLRRLAAGTSHLSYALYSDSARTTVWGNTVLTGVNHTGTGLEELVTVYGSVGAGQNVPAGAYADTVTVTVTF